MEAKILDQLDARCLQAQFHIRRQVWETKRRLHLTTQTFVEYLEAINKENP